jgi:hypothetical protein
MMTLNGVLGGRRVVSLIVLRVFVLCVVVLGLFLATSVAVARASFGIEPGSLGFAFDDSEGIPETQAGSHPYAFQLHFKLNFDEGAGRTEGGEMRDAITTLPPGMVGNLTAVPACPRQSFEGLIPDCPPSTQIGVMRVNLPGLKSEAHGAIYNLVPPPGVVSEFGFSSDEFTAFFSSTVRSEEGYRVRVEVPDVPLEVSSVTAIIWGTPAAASHDSEREGKLPPGSTLVPFLTLPTSCGSPVGVSVAVDSRLNPGAFFSESALLRDLGGDPQALSGCESVPFTPTVLVAPTTTVSESPSGLGFQLKLPDQGLLDPNEGAVSETEPETMEVQLPPGVTANPAAANGLQGCTEAQIGYKQTRAGEPVFDEQQPACPEASKLGTLSGTTPLLEEPLEGEVYLASPDHNPFGSLLALYIVARVPHRGVLIKLAAEAQIDHTTGQITTTIKGMPPLPYSLVELHLRGGSRAPLITPQACGEYHTTARLRSFAQPGETIERSSPFTISTGAGGGACVSSEAGLPNRPGFSAGVTAPVAGAFSSFVFNVSREDGTQRLGAITASLPEGLLGRLAGVQYCSDAQIAAATARSGEGQGALEQSSPSCPEASQVGVVNITAGAGPEPFPVQGKAYLAGPYKNAPLSLAIITPAVAGPFDLGTVVVRVALYINSSTAQISAVSDPIPTILDGIPLDVRSVSLEMNRTGFMFNPTSCEPMSIGGEAISTPGQTAGLSNRFQVGGCQGLPFKPAMTISTQGKTSKANGASLTVKVSQKPGEADIHKVDLTLPKILPARLTTLQQACTEAQFAANPAGCPVGSFIGTAKAITPVLSVPLTGPAILVSHGGAAFPDVVFLLQANERGSDIRIDLDGKTDIKKGVTYSRFETVPDAPIASFETSLPQGPHSVLSANGNLCASKLAIPTEMVGQNGALVSQSTKVTVTGCPKAKVLTRAQKLAIALKACHKKPKGNKRQACERTARKKYGPVKKKAKKAKKK